MKTRTLVFHLYSLTNDIRHHQERTFEVSVFLICVPKYKHPQICTTKKWLTGKTEHTVKLSERWVYHRQILQRWHTCTVALGIHARAMNTFSFMLKPAHNTQTKVNRTRTSRAMSREATPRPEHTNIQQSYRGVTLYWYYCYKKKKIIISPLFPS